MSKRLNSQSAEKSSPANATRSNYTARPVKTESV